MNTARAATNPIEAARATAGISLLGLSNTTGIPRNTLRRKIEHPHLFSLGELTEVATALSLDPDALFAEVRAGR